MAIWLTVCFDIGTPRERFPAAQRHGFRKVSWVRMLAIRMPPAFAAASLIHDISQPRETMLLRTKIVHHASELHKVQAMQVLDFLDLQENRAGTG